MEIANIQSQVSKAETLLKVFTIGGAAAAALLLFTAWQVYLGAEQFTASAQTELRESRSTLEKEIFELKSQVAGYHRLIDKPAPK